MKSKLVLLGAVFVAALLTAAFIVAKVSPVRSSKGFTLRMTITDYPADGRGPILSATKLRYQKSDGSWRMETTYLNGRVDVGFGQMGRGVFHLDEGNKRLDFLSGYSPWDFSEARLRQLPGFVGEETLLGLKSFHFHSVSEESGELSDTWICPPLQGFPIKRVSVFKNGAKNVHEVTEVNWGEPSFTVPDYPVDKTRYEQTQGSGSAASVQKQ